MDSPRRPRSPLQPAPHRLALVGAVAAFALVVSCSDGPTAATSTRSPAPPGGLSADLTAADLPLSITTTSSAPAFEIKQEGGGIAGRFEITNENSAAIALDGVSRGSGHALLAWNLGLGRAAVVITSNPANTRPALDVSSQSDAPAVDARQNNANTTAPAFSLATSGGGDALLVNHRGATGNLAVFETAGVPVIRFDLTGAAFFNGGTKNKGADVAEAFAVEGHAAAYEPGDVLVISERSDRTVARSARAYSPLVAGVYAAKPGVLLMEEVDDAGSTVPLGVVGVIPTKVSAENGAIRRGDLLVTARTPGHAMRGTDRRRMAGATLGKALEEFRGPGTGVIRVLVNAQ